MNHSARPKSLLRDVRCARRASSLGKGRRGCLVAVVVVGADGGVVGAKRRA